VLRSDELQLARGEPLRDTALGAQPATSLAIGVRTGPDAIVEELAANSAVPIVNMLTARHHPCQALADLLTLREGLRPAGGACRVAYVGDGNNVARSLAVTRRAPPAFTSSLASPPGYSLVEDLAVPDRRAGAAWWSTTRIRGNAVAGRGARPSTPTCG